MLGLQSWIALPAGREEIAPSFQHFAAETLPVVKDKGFKARIIAGSSFGAKAAVDMVSEWFYVEVALDAGMTVPLDADHEERAIYVVDGEIEIANERFEGPRLLIFRPGDRITVKATRPARMMFLGGTALGRPAPHLVEFRLVEQGAHRAGQGRLEGRAFRPCAQRPRIHSAAGVTGADVPRRVHPTSTRFQEQIFNE